MSEIRFDGEAVVVTGAGSGLGKAYALEFARRGASVVVNDPGGAVDGSGGSASVAEGVVSEIEAAGGKAVASFDPVGTPESGRAVVQTALDAFGRLDGLVCNAGILRNADFEDAEPDGVNALIATHLHGSFWTAQAAFRAMKKNAGGRIVFVASNAGFLGSHEQASYCMVKAGVIGLCSAVALEGAEHGIRANALMPMALTRMAAVRKEPIPDMVETLSRLRARLEPEFVVPLVVYLASSACPSSHGVFSAAAGRYARAVLGIPRGWASPGDRPASVEDVAAHWAQIEARDDVQEPESTTAELVLLASQLL